MTGGLHFTPEQIKALPLSMQLQIGLGIADQLAQTDSVAEREKPGGGENDAKM